MGYIPKEKGITGSLERYNAVSRESNEKGTSQMTDVMLISRILLGKQSLITLNRSSGKTGQ